MKIKIIGIIALIFFQTIQVFSQTTIENILQSVKSNNKQLEVSRQNLETIKLSLKTGIYPNNPEIEYAHKFGDIASGNLRELNVSQSFDFPTVYFMQKKLSNLSVKKAEKHYKSDELEILFETKNLCLELIYLNKKKNILKTRLENARKILSMLERKHNLGSANILEENKAKIQMLNMQTEYELTKVLLQKSLKQLMVLDGNNTTVFNDSIFETIPNEINPDSLKNQCLILDPKIQMQNINKQIAVLEKQLQKAKSLPTFEIGYTSEFSKYEKFQGLLFGLSVPIWEDKNTIKHASSNIVSTNADYENTIFQKTQEIEQIFADFLKYRELYDLSVSIISEIESERLLQIALEEGEISALKYFSEIMFFYHTFDNMLIIEKELNMAYSKLVKYILIKSNQ